MIPGALNIDPGLTPTSPVLSAPRGGEGRYGGATNLLFLPGGGEAGWGHGRVRLSNRWYKVDPEPALSVRVALLRK
jgi:hypothetical protein